MISINDFNHLKLLYEQFFKMNNHIKKLILEGDWESVDYAVQDKEALQRKILSFEKPRLKDIKLNPELLKFRKNLIELEKENIELVKKLKNETLSEIHQVKKMKRVLNAYEPASNNIVSTFQVEDTDDTEE